MKQHTYTTKLKSLNGLKGYAVLRDDGNMRQFYYGDNKRSKKNAEKEAQRLNERSKS